MQLGMIINLQKNALDVRCAGEINAIGYFDTLEFRQVDKWFDFSPHNYSSVQESVPTTVSQYPLKLIFPAEENIGILKKMGFNYEAWTNTSLLFSENPCISVVLVSLTDCFKKCSSDPYGDLLISLAQNVYQSCHSPKIKNLQAANCCILPSLGYSDYCILFAEKEWSTAPIVMEMLHGTQNGAATPILSTDYVLPALYVKKGQMQEKLPHIGKELHLSVQINLKPGVTIQEAKEKFSAPGINVFQSSGSTDCVLTARPEVSAKLLDNILPKENTSGIGYVVSTKATLNRRIKKSRKKHIALQNSSPAIVIDSVAFDTAVGKLHSVLEEYAKAVKQDGRQMRQVDALVEMTSNMINICKKAHTKQLRDVIAPFVDSLSDCLELCTKNLSDERFARNELPEEYDGMLELLWFKAEESLEDIRSKVGSFLADLSRSDCFFMESEQYNHASVGSATSLLLAYNNWLNGFVKSVLRITRDDSSKYNFLITSGGCDRTSTINLFYYLAPTLRGDKLYENLPFIIQMSEMSLFDCGGSLLRMAHECLHYCGDRKREKRFENILIQISRDYGVILAESLLYIDSYLACFQDVIDKMGTEINKEELSKKYKRCFTDQLTEFAQTISDYIYKVLHSWYEQERENWTTIDYWGNHVQDWITSKLNNLFYPFQNGNGTNFSDSETIVSFLYTQHHYNCKVFWEKLRKKITTNTPDILSAYCSFMERSSERLYTQAQNSQDQKLYVWILTVLFQLSCSDRACSDFKNIPNDEVIQYLRGNNIFDKVKDVFSAYSESFADTAACMLLKATVVDYILAFVFEGCGIDDTLQLTATNEYRIPAVLSVVFNQNGRLDEEVRNNLAVEWERMYQNGMVKNGGTIKLLIERIEALMIQYSSHKYVADPLESYLQHCKMYYEEKARDKDIKQTQTTFASVCARNIATDHSKIMEMLSKLHYITQQQEKGGVYGELMLPKA